MLKLTKHLLLATTLTLSAGTYLGTASAADMSAENAIAAAKDARKQAISVGGEWREKKRDDGQASGGADCRRCCCREDRAAIMARSGCSYGHRKMPWRSR